MALFIHRFLHTSSLKFRLLTTAILWLCVCLPRCSTQFLTSLCLFVHSWTSSSSFVFLILLCINLFSCKVDLCSMIMLCFFLSPYVCCVCVCTSLCVCLCTMCTCVRVFVRVYRQPKLKLKKPLSSKRFPKHPNLDLSLLQSAPLLPHLQSRKQESREWKLKRK